MAARKSTQQSLDQQRKQFVAAKVAQGVSRESAKQQFYVQTRVKELKSAGKEVTPAVRAQLRQNWQAGKVKREGFGAPKKATTTTGSSGSTKSTPMSKRTGSETSSYMNKRPDRTGPETRSSVSIERMVSARFPWKGGNQNLADIADKRRKYLQSLGVPAKDVARLSDPFGRG